MKHFTLLPPGTWVQISLVAARRVVHYLTKNVLPFGTMDTQSKDDEETLTVWGEPIIHRIRESYYARVAL